ncbi:rod-binding protein [Acetobacter sp. DsW_063]|uniref:rod-binding protein n=1 Tax=Acetobacter sp. DsW_063 TaxID=1514894 RepID=UPI000A38A138|nr:rod-binding protein [Acetobacter sp. DsW_063]
MSVISPGSYGDTRTNNNGTASFTPQSIKAPSNANADETIPVGALLSPGTAEGPVDAKAWKAATDFEAMTTAQFLQPMFATVDESKELFGGGAGEAAFKPMLITEMAKEMEKSGGLGLARSIYRQILAMQEKKDD